jgi:serine/threonine protein kinase
MPARWTAVTESAYAWEADAVAFIRDRLPDSDFYQGWSNFEFIAEDGSVNEIDALILTPTQLVLVEIKSQPGTVTGDLAQWTWTWPDGKTQVVENPLLLANRKAKRLAGLLGRTRAFKGKRPPYVEEIVFLSHAAVRCDLSGPAGTRVFTRGGLQHERALMPYLESHAQDAQGGRMSRSQLDLTLRALEELQIRPVRREFTVGQWKLTELLDDAGVYQDYIGTHTRLPGSTRRIRIYPWPKNGAEMTRKARREAALREFRLLDRQEQHAGILRAFSLEETERGPAIVYEHPEGAERLDSFLVRRVPQLDLVQRLRLAREIADALTWAHEQGLYHRTLTPQAILVTRPDDASPGIKVCNWQVGSLADGTTSGQTLTWHDFLQVGLAGRDANTVYLAPELRGGGRPDPALLDVFSLGALTFHLLTGQPPAATGEELLVRLREGRGLRLAAALDGVDQDVDALVQMATSPDLAERLTAADFRTEIDRAIGAIALQTSPPEPGRWVHPLDAEQGSELEGGFVVMGRLGSGSTAFALLVERNGQRGVLKVARETEMNDRLRHEGEILRRLRHQHVVELREVVEVSGHVALYMELAGENTLAQRLRQEGALTLDLLQRFGDELLTVVDWLEQQGIPHRDLKPDNIGVGETRSTRKLTLKLFDFSLSAAPADNIRAGTPGYLDPFLDERKPRRWDASAERYSAAVTLHEMATGTLPQWGDGRQHPATLPTDAVPVLAAERFDPAVRDGLTRFFRTALARDPKERFDTAEAMRAAWRDLFRAIDRPAAATSTTSSDAAPADALRAVAEADPSTPLAVLGLTPRVLNALERLGVHRVNELADIPRTRLFGNVGIGIRTVREIRDLADAAARALAGRGLSDLGALAPATQAATPDTPDDPSTDPALWSVDLLLREVVSSRLTAAEQRVLRALAGLDAPVDADGPDVWPAQRDVAEALNIPRTQINTMLERARARWERKRPVNLLRDDVARLLAQQGGVATREELARALLTARGSTEAASADRLRRAGAVLWCALELEGSRESTARYRLQRGDRMLVIVAAGVSGAESGPDPVAVRQWVEQLGERADQLAESDPPLPPHRALEELIEVTPPAGQLPLPPDRLVRLAVAASSRAALTPRQELYVRGLPAARAVVLGAGALLGAHELGVEQVRQRIAARFPAAEELPGRPALDRLLEDAGVPLRWDEDRRRYVPPSPLGSISSSTQTRVPGGLGAVPGSPGVVDELAQEIADFDQRMSAVVTQGRFIALTTDPARLEATGRELESRYGFRRLSLERLLLAAMRGEATRLGVQWPVVIEADAADRRGPAWHRLQVLVQKARPAVEQALASLDQPTALLHPGILARYDLLGLLQPMQDRARHGPAVAVLIPGDEQHTLPVVDDVPLPVVHPSDWARVPRGWHRSARRAA